MAVCRALCRGQLRGLNTFPNFSASGGGVFFCRKNGMMIPTKEDFWKIRDLVLGPGTSSVQSVTPSTPQVGSPAAQVGSPAAQVGSPAAQVRGQEQLCLRLRWASLLPVKEEGSASSSHSGQSRRRPQGRPQLRSINNTEERKEQVPALRQPRLVRRPGQPLRGSRAPTGRLGFAVFWSQRHGWGSRK